MPTRFVAPPPGCYLRSPLPLPLQIAQGRSRPEIYILASLAYVQRGKIWQSILPCWASPRSMTAPQCGLAAATGSWGCCGSFAFGSTPQACSCGHACKSTQRRLSVLQCTCKSTGLRLFLAIHSSGPYSVECGNLLMWPKGVRYLIMKELGLENHVYCGLRDLNSIIQRPSGLCRFH